MFKDVGHASAVGRGGAERDAEDLVIVCGGGGGVGLGLGWECWVWGVREGGGTRAREGGEGGE